MTQIIQAALGNALSQSFYDYVKDSTNGASIYAQLSSFNDADVAVSDFDSDSPEFYAQRAISIHKVLPGGVSRVIERNDWVDNLVYQPFPAQNSHVLVKEFVSGYARLNVYRCLFSPNTPSMNGPSGTSTTEIYLPDGYVWKYLYTISNTLAQRFLSPNFMPVPEHITAEQARTLSSTSIEFRQLSVQNNAVIGELYGPIIDQANVPDLTTPITVTARSISGNTPTTPIEITLQHDALLNRPSMTLVNKGEGYIGPIEWINRDTNQVVTGLSGDVLRGPGHGADIPYEMGINKVLVTSRNIPDGDLLAVIDDNRFNALSLIRNVVDSTTSLIAENNFYVGCRSIVLTSSNHGFRTGHKLRVGATDRGTITAVDGATIYYLTDNENTPITLADSVVTAIDTVNNAPIGNATLLRIRDRNIVFNSGDLMIVDRKAVELVRSEDQIETLSFILNF